MKCESGIYVPCFEQTGHAGRLPDTGVPAVENGSVVTDFAWDPFNNSRLAAGMLTLCTCNLLCHFLVFSYY